MTRPVRSSRRSVCQILAAATLAVGLSSAPATAATITLDFDTPATGSGLPTTPLVTSAGTVTAVTAGGTLSLVPTLTGQGLQHVQSPNNADRGLLTFSFEVQSIEFDYNGQGAGDVLVEALDINGNVVDSFSDSGTVCSTACFDGQNILLDGGGIHALRFGDSAPGSNVGATLDNIDLQVQDVQQVPLPSTLVLGAGLIGLAAARGWRRQ